MASEQILFFSPFFAIWDHVVAEQQWATSLNKLGYKIDYFGCEGTLGNMCVAMSAYGLTEDSSAEGKNKICQICKQNKKLAESQKDFQAQDFFSVLSKDEKNEIDRFVAQISASDLINYSEAGVEVGKVCLYEYLLNTKKNNLDFTDRELVNVKIHFKNCLYIIKALPKILARTHYKFVVMYNSLYSTNACVRIFCKNLGIETYFIHHGMNLAHRNDFLMVGLQTTLKFLKDIVSKWPELQALPISANAAGIVTDHLLEVMKGRSVFAYSQAVGNRGLESLSLPKDKKIILVSMSSGDERFAAEVVGASPRYQSLFKDQVHWVEELLNFARGRQDLYFVIRVHPREFPNKRERTLSQQAVRLQELFKDLPANVVVNWPEQNISLYDLAPHVHLFLNAWSSVGKEMSMLGLPVVIYSEDLIWHPGSLNYVGKTKEEYFRQMDLALSEGWRLDRAIHVYRWLALEQIYSHLPTRNWVSGKMAVIFRKVINKINKSAAKNWDLLNVRGIAPEVTSRLLAGDLAPNLFRSQDVKDEKVIITAEMKRLLAALSVQQSQSYLRDQSERLLK